MTTATDKIADAAAREFAEACYNMNTIEELEAMREPDEIDMKQWGITADQWQEAVDAALADLIADENQ